MPGFKNCAEPAPSAPRETMTASPSWRAWFTPGRFAALLGALLVVNFAAVLFGGQSFFLRDFGYFSHPLAHYHREAFWRGEMPLWNPLSNCGLPFLAQWNTLTLYPGSLIYLLLPLPWSLNLFCVLHLFLGGLGMYFLARRWTENGFAAAVAGLLFTFNGFTLNCLMWPNNIAALGLMPWVVLLVQRGWQQGGRPLLLAALVSAMQMMAGAPEIILFTWLITGALFLTDCATRQVTAGQGMLRMMVLTLLVSGLAAAQLLPFLELMRASSRSQGADGAYWPIPAWGWANFFVPLFRTLRIPSGSYFQYGQEWVASYYTGVCGVMLALLALGKGRGARVWLLTGLAVFSISFALGDNGFAYPLLRRLAPGLEFMRFPVKFLIILNFVLPLLAAFTVTRLVTAGNQRAARALWLVSGGVVAVIVGIVLYARWHPAPWENPVATMWSGLSRIVFVVAVTALLGAVIRMTREKMVRALGLSILVLIFLDGVTQSPKTNPVIPSTAFASGLVQLNPAPSLSGHRAMLTRPAYDKVYSTMLSDPAQDFLLHRRTLFSDCHLVEGIPMVDGFYSLYLHEQRQLMTKFWFQHSNYLDSPLLDFLSVSHVNAPDSIFDWTNRPSALPLATIGQRAVFADRPTTGAALVSASFRPGEDAYLPLENQSSVTATNDAGARITAARYTAHRLDFEVTTKADTLLVVAQSFYGAWRAQVDGRSTPVLRANHAFQAVAVPAGARTVVFEYHDRAFRTGVAVTAGALALIGLLWFARVRWI